MLDGTFACFYVADFKKHLREQKQTKNIHEILEKDNEGMPKEGVGPHRDPECPYHVSKGETVWDLDLLGLPRYQGTDIMNS